jgi:hypothetical protein
MVSLRRARSYLFANAGDHYPSGARRIAGLSGAMPIDPSIEHCVFEPEATAEMGEAFEAACKELHDAGKAEVVRKLVAERIIAAANRGELDPVRLRAAALSGLPLTKMSPAA